MSLFDEGLMILGIDGISPLKDGLSQVSDDLTNSDDFISEPSI